MLKPLGQRVLVHALSRTEETKSGLILTRETATVKQGKVLAVGDVPEVKVGDMVLFPSNVGVKTDDGLVIGLVDLLAVVED